VPDSTPNLNPPLILRRRLASKIAKDEAAIYLPPAVND
jgi:hypothetical protein